MSRLSKRINSRISQSSPSDLLGGIAAVEPMLLTNNFSLYYNLMASEVALASRPLNIYFVSYIWICSKTLVVVVVVVVVVLVD